MKRMCAWCGRELDQVERRNNQPLTHGLCPTCRSRFFPVVKDRDSPSVKKEGDGRAEPGGEAAP